MEQVVNWGIAFRSSAHWHWFLQTLAIAGLAAALTILSFVAKVSVRRECRQYALLIWGIFGCMHLVISVLAAIVTKWGKVEVLDLSGDCIWFNGCVAIVYFLLFLTLRHKNQRTKVLEEKVSV